MLAVVVELRVRLARSQAVLRRRRAFALVLRSFLYFLLNSLQKCSTRTLSRSSPPRWVSPLVARTSKTPLSILRMEISRVPPPKSKTAIFCSLSDLSRPYAIAAAVGSLIIRVTLSPAIVPASFVA